MDWGRPTQSYGWNNCNQSRGWGPKHSLDRKDIAKPESYSGDITKWVPWSSTFVRYLGRQDERWPSILKKIEGYKGKVISEADEYQIDNELCLWGIKPWKEQLMLALETSHPVKRRGSSCSQKSEESSLRGVAWRTRVTRCVTNTS